MVRAPCCEKMGLKKGSWTPEEDFILINYVNKHGHKNWRTLPTQAGLLRCGKSCRLRWINYLRPDIKRGNFSREEENLIIQMHQMLGNRWSAIAARLPGRTDNEIKNVWHTHLKKRLLHHQNAETLNTKRQPKKVMNHCHHDHHVMRTETKLEEMPLNSPSCEVSTLTTNSETTNHSDAVNQHHHVPINNGVESLDDDFWSQVLSADHNSNETINNSSSDQDFQFSSCVYDNVNFWYDGYICQELPGF